MEDNTLIAAIQSGNEAAFRQLVEHHQDRVVNTCYGYVHDAEDAEDLAQEVFIEVHRSVHQFRGDAKLSTWIYRIAVTKSLDHLRAKKRKKRFSSLFRTSIDDGAATALSDGAATPDQQLEDEQRKQILLHAIQQLPDQQQTAFTLSKYEDLSYKEIAEVMDTSVASVESLLFRAKKNLQKQLHDYYHQYYKKNMG